MNAASVFVLAIIALLFILAVRYIVRSSGEGSCAGCGEESCAARGSKPGSEGPCPVALRALEAVDEKLGQPSSRIEEG